MNATTVLVGAARTPIVIQGDSLVAAAAAAASAAAASGSEAAAEGSATLAAFWADQAEAFAQSALALGNTYNTKAAATAAVGGLAANAYALVLADESYGNQRTIYQKSGGVLVLRAVLPAAGFASIAELAALPLPLAGQSAFVSEDGRAGAFVFRSSNLSAKVTADPEQGVYVAPAAAATGASGAWVRVFGGVLAIGPTYQASWFGQLADGAADDRPAVAAALALAGSEGGGVVVSRAGTSMLVGAALEPPSNVHLTGLGARVSILKAGVHPGAPIIQLSNKSNVRISHLGFDGLYTNADKALQAVLIDGGSIDCVIEDCWGANKFDWFALIKTSTRCGVRRCTSEGTLTAHNIELNGGTTSGGGCVDPFVENCTLKSAVGNGVELYRTEDPVLRARIVGNVIQNAGAAGVAEFGATGSLIEANTIRACATAGVSLRVTDVGYTAFNSTHSRVIANFISAQPTAPGIVAGAGTRFASITANIIDATQGGMSLQGVGLNASGNTITNSTQFGIYWQNATGLTCNVNMIYDVGTGGGVGSWSGIQFDACTIGTASANTIVDSRGGGALMLFGVHLAAGCSKINVQGNNVEGSTNQPYYNAVSGGGSSEMDNNLPTNGFTEP